MKKNYISLNKTKTYGSFGILTKKYAIGLH
jgi:hypothetical protein